MADEDLSMYSQASRSYDLTNLIISFSKDSKVRRAAAEAALASRPKRVIDMATGTGETIIMMAEIAEGRKQKPMLIGIDANREMLEVAIGKVARRGVRGIRFESGNVFKTRFPGNYFDTVTCSFSTKNFSDLNLFIREAYRVLRKGGKLVIADISAPEGGRGKAAFDAYLIYMRLVGALSRKRLYDWLPGSTSSFSKSKLIELLRRNGFRKVATQDFFFGIAYVITCSK